MRAIFFERREQTQSSEGDQTGEELDGDEQQSRNHNDPHQTPLASSFHCACLQPQPTVEP
jgi:hypothetical protein